MKKYSILTLTFCFLLIYGHKSYAVKLDSLKIKEIEDRIKTLEDYKGNLEQLYEINSAKLERNISDQVKQQLTELDEAKRILMLLIYIGIPGTVIGLIAVYFMAISKANKFVTAKIESIVEHKREEIIKLIETQEFDSKLKKNKKILVLNPSEDEQERIKNLFQKFKFSNVKFRVVEQYKEFDDYDIIIFNNEAGNFSQELIDQYLSNCSTDHSCFVAYTSVNLKRDHRINFSNSPYTLYHSILTTLKYNEILKLNEA